MNVKQCSAATKEMTLHINNPIVREDKSIGHADKLYISLSINCMYYNILIEVNV